MTDNESDAGRGLDLDIDDDKTDSTVAEGLSRSSKSRQRTLSFEDLPLWLQPHYTRSVESTLIAHAGTLDNPWKLDYEPNEPCLSYGAVLNQVYNTVCEENNMPSTVLSNSDVVWRYVCSTMSFCVDRY